MHWSLENTGSLNYAYLPNVDISHYVILKNHIVNITSDLGKSFNIRKLQNL